MKITPVLVVPSIEPLLPLWESLGFTRAVEMPHGDALGFVMLTKEALEVMLQSEASVRADAPQVLEGTKRPGPSSLFIEVDDLDAVIGRLPEGTEVFVERRTTSYGATESFVRDAAGNVLVFAQFAE